MSEPAVQFLTVNAESAGQRLDNYLLRELKGAPKTLVYRIIRSGEVRINKGRAQADTRVEAGQQVRVPPLRLPEAKPVAPAPAKSFAVLHEEAGWLAINKPAGVAVHGGSGVSFGVIEQLRAARPESTFLELVHRLDRETSGVLLVAKRRSALNALQQQFRDRSIHKTYIAWVLGDWPKKLKVIDKPLHKYLAANGERRVRLATDADGEDGEGAKRAISLVQVVASVSASQLGSGWAKALGSDARISQLQVTIKTGRTHQIRVHLASSGYPILGDDKYGQFDANKALAKQGIQRMHLHAWRLNLLPPGGEAQIELLAADPFGPSPA